jgi:hypothetical protein
VKAISEYTDDELRQALFNVYNRLSVVLDGKHWTPALLDDYRVMEVLEAEVMQRCWDKVAAERERRNVDLNMHIKQLADEILKPLVPVVEWLTRMIERIQKWAEGVK